MLCESQDQTVSNETISKTVTLCNLALLFYIAAQKMKNFKVEFWCFSLNQEQLWSACLRTELLDAENVGVAFRISLDLAKRDSAKREATLQYC